MAALNLPSAKTPTVDPALVAPESYKAGRAEVLRELNRLVSEQGLPAPLGILMSATVMIHLSEPAHVHSWAAHQALPEPKFGPRVHQSSTGPWRTYGSESEPGGWMGWTLRIWSKSPVDEAEGGQS